MKVNEKCSQFFLIKYHVSPSKSKICVQKSQEFNTHIFGNFNNNTILLLFKV